MSARLATSGTSTQVVPLAAYVPAVHRHRTRLQALVRPASRRRQPAASRDLRSLAAAGFVGSDAENLGGQPPGLSLRHRGFSRPSMA